MQDRRQITNTGNT